MSSDNQNQAALAASARATNPSGHAASIASSANRPEAAVGTAPALN